MDQKYQRVKVIGKGAFGKAYLVRNTEADVYVVVKQMETGQMDEKDKKASIKEASILKKMAHPNIIQYQEVFMTRKGRLCIVMEYADGGDIRAAIRNQAGELMGEARFVSWFVQACFALLHVHNMHVLHRDLKTQNIFLMSTGQVKLGDFGIARVLEATKDYAKTMVGTPHYLSPEIIQERPYRFKSDVWSLGIVLFEMATLQHPFEADSLAILAAKIVMDDIPALDAMYSSDLKALVRKMLSKDEDFRPTVRQILHCTFLNDSMRDCNDRYGLGLDLSEFSVKLNTMEFVKLGSGDEDGLEGSACGCVDDCANFSGESEPEDIDASNNPLRQSAANLKLCELTIAGKMDKLRRYLREHVSEEEIETVHKLVLNPCGKELLQQASDVVGAEKATVLLPMFQLLCFFEQILSHTQQSPEPPSSFESFKEIIIDKFRSWDVNGDGVINSDELRQVLCALGLSEAKVARMFSSADVNKDGNVDYNEFVSWLCSSSRSS
mmetsp:Transcript_30088/g.84780  ORF Transcript_30088/g.84780 Transcript_30088/m.84780 type:complete len:495 (+) Transcript_30088:118-1602(+)|eukprot:CAMPEP_0179238654 /NCGR_PEP_ID=MMETSP0797-20121207/15058_1 /TAXON_ID=47934 /ORGANISM="Dinophysis acuminata, Strain DAEP01" /LENGTH=494 /DNA_ID=CAMNT_0020945955 /DNA_START=118 /DNA_END=1602 /DNA_ORIENTATION=-